MKVFRWSYVIFLGLLLIPLLLVVLSDLTTIRQIFWPAAASSSSRQFTRVAPDSVEAPAQYVTLGQQNRLATQNQYLTAEAVSLAESLYGAQNNQYYSDERVLNKALAYWQRTCHKADGSICDDAKSGSLQCVEFIAGVFASLDDELPVVGDARQFWRLYQHRAGWLEIPAQTLHGQVAPQVGDIAAWSGGSDGHLAIVVDLRSPNATQDGSITVVQSNSPDRFDRLTWHINGQVDAWPGFTLQGFIRQQQVAPCLQKQATSEQLRWEVLAEQAAVHNGTPMLYFLKQICQTGFHKTDRQGHVLISPQGALGIAQLPASVAASVPPCGMTINSDPLNCSAALYAAVGHGADPTQPEQALPAAAYVMSTLYRHYLTQDPQNQFEAYRMALAAYNTGSATVDNAVNTCTTTNWLSCINNVQSDHHTANYIQAILGSS